MMTKDVAMEVAQDQIRVNSIHPGVIETSMGNQVASGFNATTDQIASSIPLKRLGTPEDVAYLVVFLASDESWIVLQIVKRVDYIKAISTGGKYRETMVKSN
ncbi:SDR family oxidoreductase [Paenibacillus sp. GSMTC-2017]|nr:SDR family oxidoreductase [Paenibacillus sp. GSMTC-2017]